MRRNTNKLENRHTFAAARATASGSLEAWQPFTGVEVNPHSVLVCSFREDLNGLPSCVPGCCFYVFNSLYTVPIPTHTHTHTLITPSLLSYSYPRDSLWQLDPGQYGGEAFRLTSIACVYTVCLFRWYYPPLSTTWYGRVYTRLGRWKFALGWLMLQYTSLY